MKKIVVTGGRGFIGSNVVLALYNRGRDVVVADGIDMITPYLDTYPHQFIDKSAFLACSSLYEFMSEVECVIHLGACSNTLESDKRFLLSNNTEYSKILAKNCRNSGVRFIYASSAATYGDGAKGYSDRERVLSPLNLYGMSKYLFDEWLLDQPHKPVQWVGLKFFNVYGPRENHKGYQASVPFRKYVEIRSQGWLGLFKSYHASYPDGGQLRDFVYISDVVDSILFFLDNPEVSGIYNIGTGCARSFNDLASALFLSLSLQKDVRYIEMPEQLRSQYQYFTQADLTSLRDCGYVKNFMTIEEGVAKYADYLNTAT